MKLLHIIIILFSISLIVNIVVLIEYFEKRDLNDLYARLTNSQSKISHKIPQIPDFYKKDTMMLSLEKNVTTKQDFDSWREKIISKFIEIYDIPSVDKIRISSPNKITTIEKANFIINKYTMKAVDGDIIVFFEMLPKKTDGELLPAVFVIPGSGNQGAADVINEQSSLSKYYYHKGIGQELVNAGFAVYVIENRGWGERRINGGSQCQEPDVFCSGNVLNRQLENFGKNLHSLQISDSLQVVKFIQSNVYIDSENISVAGLSLGGGIAIVVSALIPDIQNTIVASGLVSIYQTTGSGATPGMLRYFDFPDLAATIAPRNLYLSWGENERSVFGYEANTLYSANMIKKAYTLFDAEDNFVVVINEDKFNDGHTFDIPSILEFLKNHTD